MWEADRLPELVGVAVGAFAEPAFSMPEQAVWDQDKHQWLTFPETLPSHRRNPVRSSR